MSEDVIRELREKAERAREFAARLSDPRAKANLLSYADELEAEAVKLATESNPGPPQ